MFILSSCTFEVALNVCKLKICMFNKIIEFMLFSTVESIIISLLTILKQYKN